MDDHISQNGSEISLEHAGSVSCVQSSFLGKIICCKKRFSRDGSLCLSHGLRFRRDRRCLRKFGCTSSCDVLPSAVSSTTVSIDKPRPAYNRAWTGEDFDQFGNSSNPSVRRGSSIVRRGGLRQRLGYLLCQKGLSANRDRKAKRVSESSSWGGNWCLTRPAVLDDASSQHNISHASSSLESSINGHVRGYLGASRTSSSSSTVIRSDSISNDDVLQNLPENTNTELSVDGQDELPNRTIDNGSTTDVCIDFGLGRGTPRSAVYDRPILGSSVFSGSGSNSRTRVPFLFGMAQRARSFEVISSPLSYMSSPDLHLSNSDIQGSYLRGLPSPNLSRATSSPEYQESSHESFRAQTSSGTPIFRSFRPFAFPQFEDNNECYTYGGLSEQVFMWEANLIFGGIASQDQYRDLRLDIDNMSYEDLLALEESIGSVSTGLHLDVISKCLRSKAYSKNAIGSFREDGQVKCIICQVDFEEGNELGTLQCGHSHHFSCIQEWLLLKNQCPICKASAS